MPRERTGERRFDFRGGVNTTHPEELLDATELRLGVNTRVTTQGSLEKRGGSRRIHAAALGGGAPVLGLWQWDAPAGREVVALAGGRVYTKLAAAAAFTDRGTAPAEVGPTPRRAQFATHRVGAAVKLYVAFGGVLYAWDGAAWGAVPGAPAATDLAVYKGRLFAATATKRLFWSKIAAPDVWDVAQGAGFADVETFDTDPLAGVRVVGSSLLLFKGQSTARFTGIDQDDIRIDSQTEGVAPDVGLVAAGTCIAVEHAAFGLSDRGPFTATEGAIQADIGTKVLREFDGANKAAWQGAVAAHHPDRKEVWVAFPAAGDGAANATVWAFNYRTGAWAGPWRGMAAASLCSYTRPDGRATILRGGYDGFVREEDVPGPCRDDQAADGTGGTPVAMLAELPPLFFEDPGRLKRLRGDQHVEADLGVAGVLACGWRSEQGRGTLDVVSVGPGVRDYVYRLGAAGRRVVLTFAERTAAAVRLTGVLPSATLGGRVGRRGGL